MRHLSVYVFAGAACALCGAMLDALPADDTPLDDDVVARVVNFFGFSIGIVNCVQLAIVVAVRAGRARSHTAVRACVRVRARARATLCTCGS